MAVAYKNEKSKIKIWEIKTEKKESKFLEKFTIETEEVDLLDFSVDSIYMIYRDVTGRSFCYDVK